VHAEEKLTAFLELESTLRAAGESAIAAMMSVAVRVTRRFPYHFVIAV
jgi:hypothetical protein